MSRRELTHVAGIGHNPEVLSSAARYGDLVWTAGQVPVGPDGTVPEDFGDQVRLTLDNLEKVLEGAGASLGTLLKVNAFLASLEDSEVYNRIYLERFAGHERPPRTTVEVGRFPSGIRLEIEAVAHVAGAPAG
jgi:2-iminobutanoate/2-iminopropanoate deaminase